MRIIAFVLYFATKKDLIEGLSGMGEGVMGWWIVLGLVTVWSLLKKLKSA